MSRPILDSQAVLLRSVRYQPSPNHLKYRRVVEDWYETKLNNVWLSMIEKKRVINWSITECVWMVHQYITTNLIGLINYHHSLGTFYTFDTLWHFWLFFCKNGWFFVIFRVSHFHGWYGYQSIQYDQTRLSKVFLTSKIADNGCFRIFCKNGWIF